MMSDLSKKHGAPFIHHAAIVEPGATIGPGTRVWAFAHILSQAIIGSDCNICDHVFIENEVSIGDRVTIKSGVQLWDGICIRDDVFVGPNATFTNDPMPRSKQYLATHPITTLSAGSSIGAKCYYPPWSKYRPRFDGWGWIGRNA